MLINNTLLCLCLVSSIFQKESDTLLNVIVMVTTQCVRNIRSSSKATIQKYTQISCWQMHCHDTHCIILIWLLQCAIVYVPMASTVPSVTIATIVICFHSNHCVTCYYGDIVSWHFVWLSQINETDHVPVMLCTNMRQVLTGHGHPGTVPKQQTILVFSVSWQGLFTTGSCSWYWGHKTLPKLSGQRFRYSMWALLGLHMNEANVRDTTNS